MALSFREMTAADYDAAFSLWQRAEGIVLSDADRRENFERFLARNPGLSFAAIDEGELAGAVLCGHDGRRGYLHHLAVDPNRRLRGIGSALAARCIEALAARGIEKCHIFVVAGNEAGKRFWARTGWQERTTLVLMSKDIRRPGAGPGAGIGA